MKLKSKLCIVSVFCLFACKSVKNKNSQDHVILYKQVNYGKAEIGFSAKAFWTINFEDHTFITQRFGVSTYQNFLQKLKTSKKLDKDPIIDGVDVAIVYYKNDNKNDTLYFDGYNKWWVIENGKTEEYESSYEYIDTLRLYYPIFRDCLY